MYKYIKHECFHCLTKPCLVAFCTMVHVVCKSEFISHVSGFLNPKLKKGFISRRTFQTGRKRDDLGLCSGKRKKKCMRRDCVFNEARMPASCEGRKVSAGDEICHVVTTKFQPS